MTTYGIKTIFPVDETIDGKKHTTTKQVDLFAGLAVNEVVKLFNQYRAAGYKASITFIEPAKDDDDENNIEVVSPFDVAKSLAKQGIDYKATLKLKSKGSYKDMQKAMKLIEAEGWDMNVAVTLKINSETTLNINKPATWTDEDAIFKITPKASSDNIMTLKSLYDALDNEGYEVDITIKPKTPSADNMDDENNTFAAQLAAYPDGTMVKFKLSQDAD